MIKNILKQLWNQRRMNFWIALEIMLVFVFLGIIVNYMFKYYDAFNRPMGFDIENVYQLEINKLPSEAVDYIEQEKLETTLKEDMQTLVNRLRMVDGIEAVSVSSQAKPYCSGNSQNTFMSIIEGDSIYHWGMYREVTPEYFKVFRIQTPEGVPAGQEYSPMLVLSKNLADTLQVSRGDTAWMGVGYTEFEPYPVGIGREVRYAETWPDIDNGYRVIPENIYFKERSMPKEICVRLRHNLTDEQRTALWEQVREVCRINNLSYFYNTPFKEIRKEYLRNAVDEMKSQCWYAVFLLVNIFLGVIGTFWFRTLHRRGEIGLRLAMGATRISIFRFLIGEGLLLLSMVTPVAFILMYNVFHFLIDDVRLISLLLGVFTTWILIAFMMLLGIWYPAYQAMKIQPAEALHEE